MNYRSSLCLSFFLFTLSTSSAWAGNWPAWRGPHGTGIAADTNLPLKWSTNENVRWRVDLPDPGNSSPIIWGNRLFISQALQKENRRTVMGFDKDSGKLLWQSGVTYTDKEATHENNPYCAGTPATDGKLVYACFGSAGVYAYDFEGKEIWHRDLGKLDHMFGNSISPILYRDLCILNFGPDAKARLIALNKQDGTTVWEVQPPKPDDKEYALALAGPGMFVAPTMVSQADKNSDEKLTRTEFLALADSWFDKVDAEKAGKLSQSNFVEKLEQVLPAPEGRRSSARSIGPAIFSAADVDKNAFLTRNELKTRFGKCFTEWDDEQSGTIDEDKIRVGLHAALAGPDSGQPGPSATRDVAGSWSTPLIVTADGHDELIVNFPNRLIAYDPTNGKQLWISKGLGGSIYTSPVWGNGTLVAVSSGVGNGNAIAVTPGGRGEVTQQRRLWRLDRFKGAIGSGVIHEGYVYTISADGIAECLELKTGKKIWDERLKGPSSRNSSWSSMLLAGDKIYIPNQSGDVFVLRANPKFEELACNSVQEPTNASLAVSDGAVFLRTDKGLWCLANPKP